MKSLTCTPQGDPSGALFFAKPSSHARKRPLERRPGARATDFLQKVKAVLHSKRADAFSPLVSDTCIVGFVVVCIFKDEGVRNVEWFKKLWLFHHLPPSHPKDDSFAAARATFYDKQPRFDWRGISHRALWQGEQFDFGLAAGTELEKRLVGHVSSIIYYYNLISIDNQK
jgi:hypothetical protein